MTRAALVSQFRPEFERFLCAPIGDGKNGMLLSVLSALARLDVDPWREAAELARLPREAAVRRLASFIAAFPEEAASSHRDPKAIATHLIGLLPREVGFEVLPHSASQKRANLVANLRPFLPYIVMFILTVILAVQLFSADGRPPGHVAGTSGQAIGTSSPTNVSKTVSGNHGS